MKKLGYLFSLFVVVLMFAGCQPTVSYSNFCTHCGAGYMSQDEADHCSVAVGCPYGYKSIPVEYLDSNCDPLSETPELRKEMENIYENYTGLAKKIPDGYGGFYFSDNLKGTVDLTKEGYLKVNSNDYIKITSLELQLHEDGSFRVWPQTDEYINTYIIYIDKNSSSN